VEATSKEWRLVIAVSPPAVARQAVTPAFGPALVAGEWRDFWVYVVGPVTGAGLGGFDYQLVRGQPPPRLPEAHATDGAGHAERSLRLPI